MNINKRYSKFLFATSMSTMMALTMSFVMVAINVGFVENFLLIWLRSFGISLLVALPTSLVAAPLSRKIVDKVTKNNQG